MTGVDVEHTAERLMFNESPDHIRAARERFSSRLGGRDYVYIEVSVPHAREGFGEQYEEIFQRTVVAARGAIEKAVVGIAAVCDELDPGGRDAAAWEAEQPPAAMPAGRPQLPERQGAESAADDVVAAVESEETPGESEAEFAQRIERSGGFQFTGLTVAPLNLTLCLPGGDCLLDVPLLIVPKDRHELVRELRSLATRWAERYAAAVKDERMK
jgi:hypothetical protein